MADHGKDLDPLVGIERAMAETGIRRTSIHHGVKEGWFPQPLGYARGRRVWRLSALRNWVSQNVTAANERPLNPSLRQGAG